MHIPESCANEIIYWIWLSSLNNIGTIKKKLLLEHFKAPGHIWHAKIEDFKEVMFLTQKNISQLLDKKIKNRSQAHLDKLSKYHLRAITLKDDSYPDYLRHIPDPPIVIYCRGFEYNSIKGENALAIVGSRNYTSYGSKITERISYELAANGIYIISGMAKGIDSYAHRGALRAKGKTAAVLGFGHDIVYPPENERLMNDIERSGATISEYLPGMPPLPMNFPARNRIISGLCRGVLIIEAGEKSGSLITAGFALDQGREIFAVPGNIDSKVSCGTNRLIREGARLITCAKDIMEDLMIGTEMSINGESLSYQPSQGIISDGLYNRNLMAAVGQLEGNEAKVAACLLDSQQHIDSIATSVGIDVTSINVLLTYMELKGIIKQLPGRLYKIDENFICS
jgi:DNA processing protein